MEEQKFLENEVLSRRFISLYDIDECKIVAERLMTKYIRLKNSYPYSPELKITQSYQPIYSCPLPRKNDQMKKSDDKMDDERDYEYMNRVINDIMLKMTREEAACFTEKFLYDKTIYAVSKSLGRSRNYLEPLINSWVIRLVLAFNMPVLKGEIYEYEFNKEIELVY